MKRLLGILLGFAIAIVVMAQPKLQHPEMYIGAQGGALASMVQFSPTVPQDPLKSYLAPTAGIVFRYMGHKICGLQVEANWMQKGWNEYEISEEEKVVSYSRQLDYVEVPLLCHLAFGKRCRGFINLGPQFGYLVHEAPTLASAEQQDWWTDSNVDARIGKQYRQIENKFDWGVAGGLGFYARTRKAGVYQIEARFNYSLGTYFANSQMDYFRNSNAMGLSLCFAYLWQFKGDK